MKKALASAQKEEESELGKQIFAQLEENLEIAANDQIPICQDTGMAVFFLEIGQEVAWNMSFIEQESPEVNPRYLETIEHSRKLQNEMQSKTKQEDQ